MIKISVRDITSRGVAIEQTIPMEGIGLSAEEIDLRSPIHVKASISRVDHEVVADTTVSVDYGYLCARCLEEFHRREVRQYHFDFELAPDMEYIDLGEEIRQEMILANPRRILCKEDCKGICPKCGTNWNVEKCKCNESVTYGT